MNDHNDELHYLISDAKARLLRFLRDIKRTKKHIFPATYEQSVALAKKYIHELNTLPLTDANEYLRTHQTLFGALITSTDWQSPSYTHSMFSQAGRETGQIWATINDYKRDQHWDAHRYEEKFRKEYIDGFIKFPIHVDATVSGMAAFTTILGFLVGEKKTSRGVFMGASTYFENKQLIEQFFGENLTVVDESATEAILRTIDKKRPSVLFFDSLANTESIAVPDLERIIDHLVKHAMVNTTLVIDNTGLSVMFQPFRRILWRRSNLSLIVFESLNKYHQFGMDRVTGGVIVSYGSGTQKLFDYRDHMGTNIPDNSVASLPTPKRRILVSKLLRHGDNAISLARSLQNWIDTHASGPFQQIIYPGLPNHPAYSFMKQKPFHGSYLTIQFTKRYAIVRSYKKFVSLCISIAKKRKTHLIAGSSFGLNTTRVYLTAVRSKPAAPFIRIAAGTEDVAGMESVIRVFLETFNRFK